MNIKTRHLPQGAKRVSLMQSARAGITKCGASLIALFSVGMLPVHAGIIDELPEPSMESLEPERQVVKVEQLKKTEKPFERKFSSFSELIQYATVNLEVNPKQVADEVAYALNDPELTQAEHFQLTLILAKTQINQNLLEQTQAKVKELHDIVELPQQRLAVFRLQFDVAKAQANLPLAVRTIEDALDFANLSISEKATRELEIEKGNWYFKAAGLYLEYGQLNKAKMAIEKAVEIATELQQFGAAIERRQFLARVYTANDDHYLANLTHQRLINDLEQQSLKLLAHQQRVMWAQLLISERAFGEADANLERAFKFGQTMRNRSLQLEALITLVDSQLKQFNDDYARELLAALQKLQKLPNAFGFDPIKQAQLRGEIIRLKSLAALRMSQSDRALRLIYSGEPVTETQRIEYALLKKQVMTVQGNWEKAEMYQRVADFLIQQNKTQMLNKTQSFLAFESNREQALTQASLVHQRNLISDLTTAVIQLKQRLSGALWLLVFSLGIAGVFYLTRQPKPKY